MGSGLAKAAKASAPAGRSVIEWLKEPLQQPAPLYWLCGAEDLLSEQVLRQLRTQVLDDGFADFNHQIVRITSATRSNSLLDALSELPMMTERRLLELQNSHELNPKVADELARFLQEKLHPGLVVAVVSHPPKGKSVLWEQLRQRAVVLACDLDAKQRIDFVTYCCAGKELRLTHGQQQKILERTAGGLRLITSAVERLALFAGESRQVTDDDLNRLVHDSAEVQAWKLTEAIGKRRVPEAYGLLQKLMEQEQAPSLLSYLNSYLLGLVQVAELRPRLKTAAAIARELPRRSEFQIRKSLEELSTWSETDLATAFERLARADYRIKTGTDPLLMMQLLILHLCHRQAGRK